MKVLLVFSALLLSAIHGWSEEIKLSYIDPAFAEAREPLFIPWSTPEEVSVHWNKLSPKNVPVLHEQKAEDLSRDLYIPNPGLAWCATGGLSRTQFLRTYQKKFSQGDVLVSAQVHRDSDHNEIYWALWAPKDRAHLLVEKMKELGIHQARVDDTK